MTKPLGSRKGYNPFNWDHVKADYYAQPKTVGIYAYYGQWKHLCQLLWYALTLEGCPHPAEVRDLLSRCLAIPLGFHVVPPGGDRSSSSSSFAERGKVAFSETTIRHKWTNHPHSQEGHTACRMTLSEWHLVRDALEWIGTTKRLAHYPHHIQQGERALLEYIVIAPFFDAIRALDMGKPFPDIRSACTAEDAYLLWEGHRKPASLQQRKARRREKRRSPTLPRQLPKAS